MTCHSANRLNERSDVPRGDDQGDHDDVPRDDDAPVELRNDVRNVAPGVVSVCVCVRVCCAMSLVDAACACARGALARLPVRVGVVDGAFPLHVVDGAIARCRSPGGENVLVVDSVPFEHTKLVLCVDVHYRAVGGTHCDLASATLLCVESEWGDFLPVHQPVERLREYRRSELVDDDDATWSGVDAAVHGIARDLARGATRPSSPRSARARVPRARGCGVRARVARAPCADAVIRRASAGCGSAHGMVPHREDCHWIDAVVLGDVNG